MGVIDNIKKAGSTVTREASRFSQAQLSQRKLRSLQGDVARAEQELGGLVVDLAEGGDLAHPSLDAPLGEVRRARALVAEKEAEIAKLKADGDEASGGREAYAERLKTQLGGWSAEIEQLKAKAGSVSADAKAEYEEQLANLRKQRDALAAKVSEIEEAGEDAWDDARQGAQAAWDAAKESFQKARARFGQGGGA